VVDPEVALGLLQQHAADPGRRVATLEAIAVMVARRIDAIRLTNERYTREIREQEISKLATEAELRALRAQINPHFLFNALTEAVLPPQCRASTAAGCVKSNRHLVESCAHVGRAPARIRSLNRAPCPLST
jgi:hypothetical protein